MNHPDFLTLEAVLPMLKVSVTPEVVPVLSHAPREGQQVVANANQAEQQAGDAGQAPRPSIHVKPVLK